MTAIVTVANRKPMSLNPLRSAIAMLRLTEKSNVGAEKTFLKNCGCEYCVKFDLQPLLLIHAESRRQLDEFCITPAAAPAWAKVACRQFPNVEYGHVRQSAALHGTIQTRVFFAKASPIRICRPKISRR
jgi:hypothetical protein